MDPQKLADLVVREPSLAPVGDRVRHVRDCLVDVVDRAGGDPVEPVRLAADGPCSNNKHDDRCGYEKANCERCHGARLRVRLSAMELGGICRLNRVLRSLSAIKS